jgi:hypothetical protein
MTVIISGDNGVSDVDGSAGTPAIRGTDANTGIFFPAADTIAFAEGGAEAMRGADVDFRVEGDSDANLLFVDAGNDRVAIGTNTPSYLLQVVKNQAATTNISVDNNTGNAASHASLILHTGGASSGDPFVYFYNEITDWSIGCDNSDSDKFKISKSSTLGTNDYFSIDSSGNLLIGTTTQLGRITAETGSDECIFAINSAGGGSATMVSWNKADSGNNYFHAFFVDAGNVNVGNIDYNRAAGLVRYNTTSDATLKNIIGDSDNQKSVEILNSTRIREFAWKNDAEQKPQIGVIKNCMRAVSVGGDIEKTDDGNVTTEHSFYISFNCWLASA